MDSRDSCRPLAVRDRVQPRGSACVSSSRHEPEMRMNQAIQDAASPTHVRHVRRVGWAILWLALVTISIEFLLTVYARYHQQDPGAYALFWTRRGWLWAHLAGGALTIVLGPLQFFARWPRTCPRLHRWTGRIYLAGMLIACTGATGLIATSPAPFEIRSAFAATALAWLTTAFAALSAIHRGDVRQHRRWMIRNYLVTLSPITFRILLPVSIALKLAPSPATIATLLWLSWLAPQLVYEGGYRLAALIEAAPAQRARAGR